MLSWLAKPSSRGHAFRSSRFYSTKSDDTVVTLISTAPLATAALAHFFASQLNPCDCYLLYGGVGAGKTFFSRSFIRAAALDPELPVPSPTFLLLNTYEDHGAPPIHHFDLYRLEESHDLVRLDLHTSFQSAVSLIEWPERLKNSPVHPKDPVSLRLSLMRRDEQVKLTECKDIVSPPTTDDEAHWDTGDACWRRIDIEYKNGHWGPRIDSLLSILTLTDKGKHYGLYVL